jgi:hypothetical protein
MDIEIVHDACMNLHFDGFYLMEFHPFLVADALILIKKERKKSGVQHYWI